MKLYTNFNDFHSGGGSHLMYILNGSITSLGSKNLFFMCGNKRESLAATDELQIDISDTQKVTRLS